MRDALQKTVVLFYDFDSDMEAAYAQLHFAASQLANCASAWHIEASGKVHDRKYHAGASKVVSRKRTLIQRAEPPYVKVNIETIAIGVGRQTLHFFPDRFLVCDQKGVGRSAIMNSACRLAQPASSKTSLYRKMQKSLAEPGSMSTSPVDPIDDSRTTKSCQSVDMKRSLYLASLG